MVRLRELKRGDMERREEQIQKGHKRSNQQAKPHHIDLHIGRLQVAVLLVLSNRHETSSRENTSKACFSVISFSSCPLNSPDLLYVV